MYFRAAHQNHYEQFGTVAGKLSIDQVNWVQTRTRHTGLYFSVKMIKEDGTYLCFLFII